MGDRLGGIPVRANLEGVLALDFEQIGDLRKDPRDGQVFHVSPKARSAEKSRWNASKTFGLDAVVQYAGTARGQRTLHCGHILRIGQAEQTAAAAGAAHFRGARAGCERARQ